MMIGIRLLLSSALLFGGSALAANESPPTTARPLWPCGASLLPCHSLGESSVPAMPYWRGTAADRPIRVSHTRVFPMRNYR